ncbi:hypothetical protein [Streptomyces sp. AC627_RSS907]|uniref:hypothetical protein n=1 Tax=Streptomyces sp. AC627_RSS907 TaxID=2823684 RepID=UPI001C22D650|nr:hypothetical protein [Streptomyces sp. AC627_RSS907]
MRRTARALSVAVLASAALGVVAGPGAADPGVPPPAGAGEPAPEAGPGGAGPAGAGTDGNGTVPCAPGGGTAPGTHHGTSQPLDEGDDATTARIPPVEGFEGFEEDEDPEAAVGPEDAWTADGANGPCSSVSGDEGGGRGATATGPGQGDSAAAPCPEPAAPHRDSATARGTSCATKPPGATVDHGVRAGTGGSFTDSVPALITGGVLIAGACGAAAHRLRLRLRGEDGDH